MQSSESRLQDIAQSYTTAVEVLYKIGKTYYYLGKSAEAQHLLRTSLELLEANEARPQQRLKLLLLYGQVLIVDHLLTRGGGSSDLQFSIISDARQVAKATHDQQGIADALSLLGQAHYFTTVMSGAILDSPQSGKYDQALAYQQQALKRREALHDTRGISESTFQIGGIYERWQQFEQAEGYYTKGRQLAEQYNHPFERTEPGRHLAIHALRKGNLDQALDLASQTLQLREAVGFNPYLPLDHLLLRDIYQLKGDPANAEAHAKIASTLAEEMGYPLLVTSMPNIRDRLASQEEEA